jgi:hypothetical protein
MSRTLTLVQMADLPWQDGREVRESTHSPSVPDGVQIKVLSVDQVTGAAAFLLKAPAGWTAPPTEHHRVAQEGLLIEGRAVQDGRELLPLSYYRYPSGTAHGRTVSDGHTAIILVDGAPDGTEADGSSGTGGAGTEPGLSLETLTWRTSQEVWGGVGFDVPSGVLVKGLRSDALTGGQTVVMQVSAGWSTRQPEYHNALQQEFLLEGDVTFGDVEFHAPAYFCFPPGAVHGPASTRAGMVMLVAFDGPIDVVYPPTSESAG